MIFFFILHKSKQSTQWNETGLLELETADITSGLLAGSLLTFIVKNKVFTKLLYSSSSRLLSSLPFLSSSSINICYVLTTPWFTNRTMHLMSTPVANNLSWLFQFARFRFLASQKLTIWILNIVIIMSSRLVTQEKPFRTQDALKTEIHLLE